MIQLRDAFSPRKDRSPLGSNPRRNSFGRADGASAAGWATPSDASGTTAGAGRSGAISKGIDCAQRLVSDKISTRDASEERIMAAPRLAVLRPFSPACGYRAPDTQDHA